MIVLQNIEWCWQEVRDAAAPAPEGGLPGLFARVAAEPGAPGGGGPVPGELPQCLPPWRPAPRQEEYCGAARFVNSPTNFVLL